MAYNNEFFYDRDNSVDSIYKYTSPQSFLPIYGSSVNFNSRLNFLQTVDNSLKIIPASENNLTISYNLKFLLNDLMVGNLLKTIETAGATKYLRFPDPSNLYTEFTGLVEKYNINKISKNLSEVNITLSNYGMAPEFKWRYSSFFVGDIVGNGDVYQTKDDITYSDQNYNSWFYGISSATKSLSSSWPQQYDRLNIKKNEVRYFNFNSDSLTFDPVLCREKNSKIFIFGKEDGLPTRNFYFQTKYPFVLENEIDVYRMDYKNSFVQNIKYKQNSNTLKQFSLRFENIQTDECLAILFFLEKRYGYKRFIYEFPVFMKKYKVFVCNQWSHTFKYDNCHDITLQLIEDPAPNIYFPKDVFAYDRRYLKAPFSEEPFII